MDDRDCYARVSTGDQSTAAQETELRAAGAVRIFSDTASGAKAERPQLDAALAYLNPGDTLVVWRLDRLGRSLPHLMATVQALGAKQIEFRSLTEAIDTSTPTGRLLFHIAGAFAEFERDLIRDRTVAGLSAARDAGRVGGRPNVMTPAKLTAARAVLREGGTHSAAAAAIGVSLSSLRRALRPITTKGTLMNDDGIAWEGPRCPDCNGELDAEPVAGGGALKVTYSCPAHGVIAISDPFP